MGFGGISIWQLLIILAIIVLIFGTKRMRNLGSDLGNALRGFRKAIKEEPTDAEFQEITDPDINEHSDQLANAQKKVTDVDDNSSKNKPQKTKATSRSSHKNT